MNNKTELCFLCGALITNPWKYRYFISRFIDPEDTDLTKFLVKEFDDHLNSDTLNERDALRLVISNLLSHKDQQIIIVGSYMKECFCFFYNWY